MARVYVSSTFKDLKDCRAKVRHVLRELDHIDVAMEYYVAEDARPVDKCLQDVEQCDLYICLVAWRYGFVPEGYEYSITELEYRRAVKSEKPVLAFLLDEEALWPPSRVDRNRDQVDAFRETLAQNHLTAFFTSDADIGARVNAAVVKWEKERGIAPVGGRTDWDAYRQAMIDRYRLVKLDAIAGPELGRVKPIAVTDIFVPQQTSADEAAAELREPSLRIIGRDPRQVFLGGPGSGKTMLLQYAMLTLCDPAMPKSKVPLVPLSPPIPFLVDLRSYTSKKDKGQVGDFVDYLVAQARDSYVDIKPSDLRTVLERRSGALVLFDGLDEVFKDGDRDQVTNEIVAFARRYGGTRIVVSSRNVGYDSEPLQDAEFTHYSLQPFGLAEIRRFLPEWYRRYAWDGDQRDATELVEKITINPRLRELAGNPLLLTMMAIISKRHELPETRWKLYEECTDVLLERWDIKRKRIEHDEVFPLDFRMSGKQKAEILRRVSRHMLDQREQEKRLNAIRREPLLGIIADYLEENRGKEPGEAEIIAGEILDHLRERTAILVEIGTNLFGFVHRSFMEYFAACDLLAEFNRGKADYEWLNGLYGTYGERGEWQEVLLLLIAMLSDQEFPIREVVDHLLGLKVRKPRWNVVFAAGCLAEAGATDGEWARGIVDRLGDEILDVRGSEDNEPVQQLVRHALRAFSMLVLTVRPSERLTGRIDECERERRLSRSVAAWQMKLALRPKEERLSLAVQALGDKRAAVRLGAVSALEREWPGRRDVGERLIRMLRVDRSSRVRQAAVHALGDAWPKDPRVLQAIAERASDTTDYFHVVWLVRYIASEWPQELSVLEIVLQLATNIHQRPRGKYPYIVGPVLPIAWAIARGWGGRPGIGAWLRERFESERDSFVRSVILEVLTDDERTDDSMIDWLQEQVDDASDLWPWTRETALLAIAERWEEKPNVRAWLAQCATTHPRDTIRLLGLAVVGGYHEPAKLLAIFLFVTEYGFVAEYGAARSNWSWEWWQDASDWGEHPGSLPLLEERAIDDPSPWARQVALGGVYAYRRDSGASLDFLLTRLKEEPDRDTRALLLLWLSEAASGGTTSSADLAETLGLLAPARTPPERRLSPSVTRLPKDADDQFREAFTQAAKHDEDAKIRAAAAQAVAATWPE